jgi:hypothetical protein
MNKKSIAFEWSRELKNDEDRMLLLEAHDVLFNLLSQITSWQWKSVDIKIDFKDEIKS